MNEVSSNKRIFKNTFFLYVRMLFSMLVSLYTSRVLLAALGVSDFGIYNVIGGFVVLISIINNAMSSATQRFITFELGRGDLKRVSNTFCISMTIHIAICFLILIVGETLGLYYLEKFLNVPPGREGAAFWLFQISLLTLFFNIIRVPYHASVIAYEKMDFFAFIGILESILQLAIVYILTICNDDRLILYGLLLFSITVLSTFIYKIYCNKIFETCKFYWFLDKSYFKQLTSYFGWNLLGAIGTTGTNQVGNMLINFFCGPVINASYGVANRVNIAINSFASNFQLAFTPQIVKLYSQGNRTELFKLMYRSALLSFYLLFIIAAPLCFNLDYVLGLWLIDVPPYVPTFIIFMMVYNLIDSVQAPFWKVIAATGDIKVYQIWLNLVLILNIPFSFYFLKNGYPPYVVVIISASINLVSAIIRTIHVKFQVGISITQYLKNVVFKIVTVSILYILPMLCLRNNLEINNIGSFIIYYVLSVLYIAIVILAIGISKDDRTIFVKFMRKRLFSKKN